MTQNADATKTTPANGHEAAAQTQASRPLVAGNWKMNGVKQALTQAIAIKENLEKTGTAPPCDVMICPPATLLMVMAELAKSDHLSFGAQDCHAAPSGAHTGDISVPMLKDSGACAVIVGHSERREDHGETDALVRTKAESVHSGGLIAIVCIGETAGQRAAGQTLNVVARQLAASLPEGATAANTVVAYEPVWAIGTGLVPTLEDVTNVHALIRDNLKTRFGPEGAAMRILYGGSVKPANAGELMSVPNVNGALVGGASLKADDFLQIVGAYT